MDSSIKEVRNSLKAQVNIVLSVSALKAARVMKEKYNIPYVVGVPVGEKYADIIVAKIKEYQDIQVQSAEIIRKFSASCSLCS